MRRLQRSVLALTALAALVGCKSEPTEPAPLSGGEFLTYRINAPTGRYDTKVELSAEGDGFVMSSDPSDGQPPMKLESDLSAGRDQIKAHYLGSLWLPPSKRKVGEKVLVGQVTEERVFDGFDTLVVAERGGAAGKRFYHESTGFLVALQIPTANGPYQGVLTGSNIDGLAPDR